MKTPVKQTKLFLNKYPTFHKSAYNTIKKSKVKNLNLYDEIELKDRLINRNKRKIKDIKIDSIKQLVYANKNIPKKWKTKQDYPTQVLEIFSKDPKFLNYVGRSNNTINNNEISKTIKSNRNNLTNNNYFKITFNKINKNNNYNTETYKDKSYKIKNGLSLSNISENNKNNNFQKVGYYTTPKKNRCMSLRNNNVLKERELLIIMDELQTSFPIKEKLYDFYTKDDIDKINIKNETLKNKLNKCFKKRYPIILTEKSKNDLKKNIFINLISSYKDSKNNTNENVENNNNNKKYIDDFEYDIFKKRKELIKNYPQSKKYLERVNFYGPYYSYCPHCGIRNLNFYQKLPLHQLIKFTNNINKYRLTKQY